MSVDDRRIGFTDGQLLTADDLADDRHHEARMRGLHTRVVHATWGISLGLDVQPAGDALAVSSGLAHDCHGRELVLSDGLRLRVPEEVGADGLVLVVRHDDGPTRPALDIAAVRVGPPGREGVDPDPRRDRPAFAWRRFDDVAWGEEVPLGTVTRAGQDLVVDGQARVYVRALERPHVGFGTQLCARSRPQLRQAGALDTLIWSYAVDTESGGFTDTPDYFAIPSPEWATGLAQEMLGAFTTVAAPSATGFTFSLAGLFARDSTLDRHLGPQPFELTWFGLEDMRGCPPDLWSWALAVDWGVPRSALPFLMAFEGGNL